MKTIFKIAKTELLTLFYSPVAWLVLFLFAIQSNSLFTDLITRQMEYKSEYGASSLWNITSSVFCDGFGGLFPNVLKYLYLYLPLLTMGLMSREIKSGSIKLLFSSPVSNVKIVLGKYLSMMIYCLALVGIILVPILFSGSVVVNFEMTRVLLALFGIYLLICTYSAIGLFFSCLTSYQVVAAVGTVVTLALLNGVGSVGQDIAFVRDITYWLSLSGRSYDFIRGITSTEGILYFIIVITLFLTLSILKLEGVMKNYNFKKKFQLYSIVVLITIGLGYVTSRDSFKGYWDSTRTKENTLTVESQRIVNRLKGDLKITTYVNLLGSNYWSGAPSNFNSDKSRFEKYFRFKPDIDIDYVYYYARTNNNSFLFNRYSKLTLDSIAERTAYTRDIDINLFKTPKEIQKIEDVRSEGNQFFRVLSYDGKKVPLRLYNDNQKVPTETEISAAMKMLTVESPKVAFITGHGERGITRYRDIDYTAFVNNKGYRYSLLNQGLKGFALDITKVNKIDDNVSIIVIADPKVMYDTKSMDKIMNFIDKGGNAVITCEPKRRDMLNPLLAKLGVEMTKGQVVEITKDGIPNEINAFIHEDAAEYSYRLEHKRYGGGSFRMISAGTFNIIDRAKYKVGTILFSNDERSWNEVENTTFDDETKCVLNTEVGEVQKSNPLVIGLTKKFKDRMQKIMIIGDADCISNGELSKNSSSSNNAFIPCIFEWLTDGEYPINTQRPKKTDNDIRVGSPWILWVKIFFMFLIPFGLLFIGGYILFMRKRR